jgi:hypothetical protein
VIIWVNGTFGAGKTTTARQLAGRLANARPFDPEQVGYLLMRTLEDHEFGDFQDLAPWRELVPPTWSSTQRTCPPPRQPSGSRSRRSNGWPTRLGYAVGSGSTPSLSGLAIKNRYPPSVVWNARSPHVRSSSALADGSTA